jgi:hypothetical protein
VQEMRESSEMKSATFGSTEKTANIISSFHMRIYGMSA